MPMRQQHAALHGLSDDLLDGQFGAVEGRLVDALPGREDLARPGHVAAAERQLDLGERMAELAKSQRQIEHHHVDREREQHAERRSDGIEQADADRRARDQQQPGVQAVTAPAARPGYAARKRYRLRIMAAVAPQMK